MSKKHCNGQLFVISAPSGTGKTTLCRELMKALPELFYSISTTTRTPRNGEKDGQDYHFVSKKEFDATLRAGGFLEHAEVFGNWYGTPVAPVEAALADARDVVMDVDVQGAMEIRKKSKAVSIFLLPPSMDILEQRLKQRKTDNEEEIQKRIAQAKYEIGYVHHYDYAICNDRLDESIRALKAIVRADRCRTARNAGALAKLGFPI